MGEYDEYPTEAQVIEFELLEPLLESAMTEMREFAKKKQDGVVKATKVTLLNRLMDDIRKQLSCEPSARYLDPLEAVELPDNSDVVLILGQYKAAMENFRRRFREITLDGRRWMTQEFLEARGQDDEDDEVEAEGLQDDVDDDDGEGDEE